MFACLTTLGLDFSDQLFDWNLNHHKSNDSELRSIILYTTLRQESNSLSKMSFFMSFQEISLLFLIYSFSWLPCQSPFPEESVYIREPADPEVGQSPGEAGVSTVADVSALPQWRHSVADRLLSIAP